MMYIESEKRKACLYIRTKAIAGSKSEKKQIDKTAEREKECVCERERVCVCAREGKRE